MEEGRFICWHLYADDMVMLAKDEDGMKGLMGMMERYLDGKGLELNTKKTKVMRYRREEDGRK